MRLHATQFHNTVLCYIYKHCDYYDGLINTQVSLMSKLMLILETLWNSIIMRSIYYHVRNIVDDIPFFCIYNFFMRIDF